MGPHAHHLDLYNFLGQMQCRNFVLIVETFDFRKEDRDQVKYISKEYIGVTELFAQERMNALPCNFLVRQSAGEGKGFWNDDKLDRVDHLLKPKTRWKHANDAKRHLLHYMLFNQGFNHLCEGLK